MVDIEVEMVLIEQLVNEDVEADKSKDLDRIMNLIVDDIVYHVSGFPPVVGKEDLQNFIDGSFDQLDDFIMVSEKM